MAKMKKYRLGNQPEEYNLSEDYLSWTPVGFGTWNNLIFKGDQINCRSLPIEFTLAETSGTTEVSLTLHQLLSKEAFPLIFFGEERSKSWHRFAKVSHKNEPEIMFIIPLH